jgi:hypothetical protein
LELLHADSQLIASAPHATIDSQHEGASSSQQLSAVSHVPSGAQGIGCASTMSGRSTTMPQHSIDQTSCVTRLTISSSRITMAMLCRVYPEQGKQRRESIDVFRQTGSISRAWSRDDADPHGVRRGRASFAKIAPLL